MEFNVIGVIPARFASTRFPGKPLIDIGGKTMIQRVYEQAKKSELVSRVVVATDDDRIVEAVKSFDGEVVVTASHHLNGTSRCAEVIELFPGYSVLINIQGDEPFIDPTDIDVLASAFIDNDVEIASLSKGLKSMSDHNDSNVIKLAEDVAGWSLGFSRKLENLQSRFDGANPNYKQHIGLYAFRTNVLSTLINLDPTPSELEESLEQLRWLDRKSVV